MSACLAVACLAGGCAAGDPAGGAAEGRAAGPPLEGISVALEQSRDNENRHLIQVVLTSTGAAPVAVERLQLRAPGFTDVAPTVRADVLRPGRRLAFPVAYGAADCARSGSARVVVGHRTTDGLRETTLPVPADDPLLPRLHRRECDLRRLARAVDIGFGSDWRRTGDTAVGRLVLRRRPAGGSVELRSVEGTVLFTLRTARRLPVRVSAPQVELPVTVRPSRCDPHALIESKRSFDFPYVASLDGGRPLTLTARPDAAGVALLEQLLRDACAPS